MTIEEKAKRYDELKVTAQELEHDGCFDKITLFDLFPELKESEDERIRKALKEYFINSFQNNGVAAILGVHIKDILAWLEKQGEHANFLSKIQVGDKVTRNEDGVLVNLSQLNRVAKKDEKQGEQKSAWSKEDREMRMKVLKYLSTRCNVFEYEEVENWLKSLKDRV